MSTLSPPVWDFSRSAAGLRVLVETGVAHGVDTAALLVGTGLSADDLAAPSADVEAGQELAVARNLVGHLGDRPGLGVEAGCRYTLGSFGVWALALMTSPTVRDLARLGTQYAMLSFAFVRAEYVEGERGAVVVYGDDEIPADVRALFVERELAKLFGLAPAILGRLPGFGIETAFDGARATALTKAAGGVHVTTGADRHLLRFDRALLDQPLPAADDATAAVLHEQCDRLVQQRRRRRGFSEHIRARLLAHHADPPSLSDIAAELHLDVRTVRRRLDDEGTSYRSLTDEVRAAVALGLLTDAGLPVEAVAARLGYHDAAGFSRAFKRWTGTTPGRARLGSPGAGRGRG